MDVTETRLLSVLFAGALVGCAGSGAPRVEGASASLAEEGLYEYTANLPGQPVRGTFRVQGDTIIVNPATDYCRPVVGPANAMAIQYTCTGAGSFEQLYLRLDRRNPVQLSRWTATYRVQRRREVCERYEVRAGRQVCVQTKTETYETTEPRSGTLQVRRVP